MNALAASVTGPLLFVVLVLASWDSHAQRADCPAPSAPIPMTPPGKPPDFIPHVPFPSNPDEVPKVEPPRQIPRSGEVLVAVEEGYLTALARMVERANAPPPPDDVARGLVDPRNTLLSQWQFEGYVRDSPRHKVPRVFTRQGSVLIFEEWNMAADGASVYATPPPDLTIGKFPAVWGGLRSPSGCVSVALMWHGVGHQYSLRMAGPLSESEQREVLEHLARSIEGATPQGAK